MNHSSTLFPRVHLPLLGEEGVATLRGRCMPMEYQVWAIIAMAMFRYAPSAFVQARHKLGHKSIERRFHETTSLQHLQANPPVKLSYSGSPSWRDVSPPIPQPSMERLLGQREQSYPTT